MRHSGPRWTLALLGVVWPVLAHAQTSPELVIAQVQPAAPTVAQKQDVEKQLGEIRAMKADLARQKEDLTRQMGALDARMSALESAFGATPSPTAAPPIVTVPVREPTAPPASGLGTYEFGKGLVLARGDVGELAWGLTTYVRYLNQENLDKTYTDSFGRTSALNLREDFQFQKVTMNFKGWVFDPNFRYYIFIWTSNAQQGLSAQVVVAGNLSYQFNEHLIVTAGTIAVPSTRTLMYT
ncbi:MAG: hypothetical protein ACREE0_11205, partial [Phenylobacterium sp.]